MFVPILRSRWTQIGLNRSLSPRVFSATMYHPYDTVPTQIEDGQSATVFEEASKDYDEALSHFPPAPATISQLIETLPAVLPAAEKGPSIFEDKSSEYGSTEHYPTREPYIPHSVRALHLLLRKRNFSAAYSLLNELQMVDTKIAPSHLYEEAALDVLRQQDLSSTDKVERFTKWYSLIEPREQRGAASWNSDELHHLLLQSPYPQLDILKSCIRILNSKGFDKAANMQFLPVVVSYTGPQELESLVYDLESRFAEYARVSLPTKFLTRNIERHRDELRGMVVRCLVYHNRIDEALQWLPKAGSKMSFSLQTCDALLKKFLTTPDNRYHQYIPLVEALRARKAKHTENRPYASVLLPPPPPPPRTALPSTLRYISSHMSHPDPDRILPNVIVNFMTDYLDRTSGSTRAFKLLFRKARRQGGDALKRLTWAEMRVYRAAKRPEMVIRAFVEMFWVVGVPFRDTMTRYNAVIEDQRQMRANGEDVTVARLSGFNENSILLKSGKMWPNMEQCTAVWEALIQLIMQDPTTSAEYKQEQGLFLYEKFIAQAHEYSATDEPEAIMHPTRFGATVSHGTFHTFIHYLAPVMPPDFGERIMTDMRRFGLWPGVLHWGSLALVWGRRKYTNEVMVILNAVEDGSIVRWAQAVTPENADDAPTTVPALPLTEELAAAGKYDPSRPARLEPDLTFYLEVLRGLTYSKQLEEAKEVIVRMLKRFPIEEVAAQPPFERALRKLRDLQILLEKQHPPNTAENQQPLSPWARVCEKFNAEAQNGMEEGETEEGEEGVDSDGAKTQQLLPIRAIEDVSENSVIAGVNKIQ